jgi:hypothetical protein
MIAMGMKMITIATEEALLMIGPTVMKILIIGTIMIMRIPMKKTEGSAGIMTMMTEGTSDLMIMITEEEIGKKIMPGKRKGSSDPFFVKLLKIKK